MGHLGGKMIGGLYSHLMFFGDFMIGELLLSSWFLIGIVKLFFI